MSKRIQDLQSPMVRWRARLANLAGRLSARFSTRQRFWIGFSALCIVTTLLIGNPFWRAADESVFKEGEIIREAIISPADIYFVDQEETERNRETVRQTIRPIFSFEPNRADEAVQGFRSAWEDLQRKTATGAGAANTSGRNEIEWSGSGGAELGKIFTLRKFSSNELETLTRVLRENAAGDIYGDQDRPFLEDEIVIIDRRKPTDMRQAMRPDASMTPLSMARGRLEEAIRQIPSISPREAEAFISALLPLIQPSVIYDAAGTDNARAAAAQAVEPVAVSLKRGQKVADTGDVVTRTMIPQIAAIQNYNSSTRRFQRFFGLLVLMAALFWIAWKFISNRGIAPRLALSENKTFALFGLIVVTQTALMAAFFRIAEFTAMQNVRAPLNDPSLWSLAIPFAFGSLLMTLLADRRTALFTGMFNALVAGMLATRSLEFAIYALIASSSAAYGIGRYRSRQTVTIAGVLVGLVSAAVALALIAFTQQPFILNTLLLATACGLASGIVTAAATAVFLPFFETMFGVLTDVKLLELSNADLPILGQLALRAPGTNQHSHAVGQLAEEACRVVGGNGLLARIGALYHDIGKSAAPEHYVENQSSKNPHDRLKPSQSAKIIISHVNYGVKLAREMGLPQRIIDFIPQHHGTRTLHYFLKKAQAESNAAGEFSESDFRYPGPKPQFREAAIMMIADSCEAAARSLAEPTPENIRFIVTKIIDAILSDDQLDECDLTLRELTQIRESMIRSLVAIYHSRIDYPGYVPPKGDEPPEMDVRKGELGLKYKDPRDIPISKGGEIEDEAIDRSHEPRKAGAK